MNTSLKSHKSPDNNERRKKTRSAPGFRSRKGEKLIEGLNRAELVARFAPDVKAIAGKLAQTLPQSVQVDDLISVGFMGLMDAADRFDASRGFKFKTYAEFRIRGAIIDELRKLDWVPRSVRDRAKEIEKTYAELEKSLGRKPAETEVSKALGLSHEGFQKLKERVSSVFLMNYSSTEEVPTDPHTVSMIELQDRDTLAPFNQASRNEAKEAIGNLLGSLSENEGQVLSLYYYRELNLKEISIILDMSESRICQIHAEAIFKLRKLMQTQVAESADVFRMLFEVSAA